MGARASFCGAMPMVSEPGTMPLGPAGLAGADRKVGSSDQVGGSTSPSNRVRSPSPPKSPPKSPSKSAGEGRQRSELTVDTEEPTTSRFDEQDRPLHEHVRKLRRGCRSSPRGPTSPGRRSSPRKASPRRASPSGRSQSSWTWHPLPAESELQMVSPKAAHLPPQKPGQGFPSVHLPPDARRENVDWFTSSPLSRTTLLRKGAQRRMPVRSSQVTVKDLWSSPACLDAMTAHQGRPLVPPTRRPPPDGPLSPSLGGSFRSTRGSLMSTSRSLGSLSSTMRSKPGRASSPGAEDGPRCWASASYTEGRGRLGPGPHTAAHARSGPVWCSRQPHLALW